MLNHKKHFSQNHHYYLCDLYLVIAAPLLFAQLQLLARLYINTAPSDSCFLAPDIILLFTLPSTRVLDKILERILKR